MAKVKGLLGYGIAVGLGVAIGYVMFSTPAATVSVPTPTSRANGYPTRWTSGYMGSANGVWPGAGVSESLYPYNEMHKMTQLSPLATTQNAPNGNPNGSLVYVD